MFEEDWENNRKAKDWYFHTFLNMKICVHWSIKLKINKYKSHIIFTMWEMLTKEDWRDNNGWNKNIRPLKYKISNNLRRNHEPLVPRFHISTNKILSTVKYLKIQDTRFYTHFCVILKIDSFHFHILFILLEPIFLNSPPDQTAT